MDGIILEHFSSNNTIVPRMTYFAVCTPFFFLMGVLLFPFSFFIKYQPSFHEIFSLQMGHQYPHGLQQLCQAPLLRM